MREKDKPDIHQRRSFTSAQSESTQPARKWLRVTALTRNLPYNDAAKTAASKRAYLEAARNSNSSQTRLLARQSGASLANYDVAPDGQRFLMIQPTEQRAEAATQINVVLNWFEELKARVPTGN